MSADLSPTETVTIGTILSGIIGAIIIFLRQIGKPADPQLISIMSDQNDLMAKMVEANTEAAEANKQSTEANKLLSGAIDRMGLILEKINTDIRADREESRTTLAANTTELTTLTGKIDTLGIVMTEHTTALQNEPTISDLMAEVRKLGGKLDTVELTMREIRTEFNRTKEQAETIKKVTQENPAVILSPSENVKTEKKVDEDDHPSL